MSDNNDTRHLDDAFQGHLGAVEEAYASEDASFPIRRKLNDKIAKSLGETGYDYGVPNNHNDTNFMVLSEDNEQIIFIDIREDNITLLSHGLGKHQACFQQYPHDQSDAAIGAIKTYLDTGVAPELKAGLGEQSL